MKKDRISDHKSQFSGFFFHTLFSDLKIYRLSEKKKSFWKKKLIFESRVKVNVHPLGHLLDFLVQKILGVPIP